jgi:cysteinyl-tRNA synthetase
MIRLHDTASGEIRELALRQPGTVSMYVCGPTVYGPPHLGHGRFSLVFDVLRRYLEWSGLEVKYVSNITDIDDKIIERAKREQRPWQDITAKCERVWFEAMDAIGVMRPTLAPHATEYVEQMVHFIGQLVERGRAYMTDDGVYLAVTTVEDYGLLTHQSIDDLLAGGGEREVLGAAQKHHPADFALWKFSKPDEPSWPAPFGAGRPGWHTECVVMSLDLLGEGFDLHGGGQDLAFPHHENERAQAVAMGCDFAHHWVHNGFVVDPTGEKMSKSLGNFTNLLDLVESHDPRAYRMLVLQAHYRSPLTVDRDTIKRAEASLDGLDALARRAGAVSAVEPDAALLDQYRSFLDDDLNTPRAMAVVFETARRANAAFDDGAPEAASLAATVITMCRAAGLMLKEGDEIPADAAAKAVELDAARAVKDFARSDALRAELQAAGWQVETTKQGTVLHRG